ncbi:MAG TPA: helix-turn-helix transcriptional regulator, partial [Burkholderiales bacterium]|nr:helix-turn-helix transcriptional regulator [Burkholderiales bacterium]
MPVAAGAALLAERRRQGLSLGDVSRQLKLSVRQVEALERDDYSGFSGAVFVHGFIRNYAKLLNLGPDPLIRAADQILNPPALASEPLAAAAGPLV